MMPMAPKPKHLSPAYAAQFQDQSVVDAYRFRPPYPDDVFTILQGLIVDRPAAVLDLGCGRGDLARRLIDFADRVDAVDISVPMIAAGKQLPGGDSPRLNWICAPVEEAPLQPPYALVTAGESLHWMDWGRVLPRLHDVLVPGGVLAIVARGASGEPWWSELLPLIQAYSTNRDFVPYDIVEELTNRSLFHELGRTRMAPIATEQMIAEYIESIHSRNGFSRDRMTSEAAAAFDAAATRLLTAFAINGRLAIPVTSEVTWGLPQPTPTPETPESARSS